MLSVLMFVAVRAQEKQVSDEAEHLAKARSQVCVEMSEK
jgi:hypothetical protein